MANRSNNRFWVLAGTLVALKLLIGAAGIAQALEGKQHTYPGTPTITSEEIAASLDVPMPTVAIENGRVAVTLNTMTMYLEPTNAESLTARRTTRAVDGHDAWSGCESAILRMVGAERNECTQNILFVYDQDGEFVTMVEQGVYQVEGGQITDFLQSVATSSYCYSSQSRPNQ